MKLDHVILTIYPEATLLEKVLEDGSRVIHPISPADLAGQLNRIPLSTGLLPHNTLFWRQEAGEEQIAIYVPPRLWQPIAYDRRYRLSMPGMVFLGQGRQYTVFAVKQKPKSPETPLYHLPAPNVDGNGRICLGQAPFPTAGRKSIYNALKLFMEGSRFNHDNSRQRCVSFPDNTLELWTKLDGQKRFPLDELVPARKQLKQLMT
jgi:PRTRC genetic system protein B